MTLLVKNSGYAFLIRYKNDVKLLKFKRRLV